MRPIDAAANTIVLESFYVIVCLISVQAVYLNHIVWNQLHDQKKWHRPLNLWLAMQINGILYNNWAENWKHNRKMTELMYGSTSGAYHSNILLCFENKPFECPFNLLLTTLYFIVSTTSNISVMGDLSKPLLLWQSFSQLTFGCWYTDGLIIQSWCRTGWRSQF